ncbi:TetR/AcrR family transcriptional regulator [Amycolatopsis magusensis]|uniref:TetR/AcrR family transcriptional regulator n=1 Tax=Amycolatopsis magusensis TaxID=882444 RepID=UPI0037AB547B
MREKEPGLRARQAARTRERILAAAKERFAEGGYEGTTVRAIAAAAGVDPAAIIRHFNSKEQLFFEVLDRDSGWPILNDTPDDQLGEQVIRVWLQDWEGRDREPLLALLRAACSGGEIAERVRHAFADSALDYLETRIAPDEFREERLALAAIDIVGLVINRYVLLLEPLASMPAERVVELLGPRLQQHLRAPL